MYVGAAKRFALRQIRIRKQISFTLKFIFSITLWIMMMWNMCMEGVTRWKAALSFKPGQHLDYGSRMHRWVEKQTNIWITHLHPIGAGKMSRGCGWRMWINLWKPCFNCGGSVLWYSIFFVLLSQLFNLLQSESVVRSRTNRWQIPLKSSSNYSPKPSICPSVSTLYVQDCSSYMSEQQRAHV